MFSYAQVFGINTVVSAKLSNKLQTKTTKFKQL